MNQYGFQQYKEQSVNTMTQGEMLLLLYDELLKRLTRAELSLKKPDYIIFEQSMDRCQEIVCYLKDTLDLNYEVSTGLDQMYNFFLYEISRIKVGRNTDVMKELKPLVLELRGAFAQAALETQPKEER